MTKALMFLNLALLYADNPSNSSDIMNIKDSTLSNDINTESTKKKYTLDTLLNMLKLKYIQSASGKRQDFLDKALNIPSELKVKLNKFSTSGMPDAEMSFSIGVDTFTKYLIANTTDNQEVNKHFTKLIEQSKTLITAIATIAAHETLAKNLRKSIAIIEVELNQAETSQEDQIKSVCQLMELQATLADLEYKYNSMLLEVKQLINVNIADIDLESVSLELLNTSIKNTIQTETDALKTEELTLDIKAAKYNLYDSIIKMIGFPKYTYKRSYKTPVIQHDNGLVNTKKTDEQTNSVTFEIDFTKIKDIRKAITKRDQAISALNKNQTEIAQNHLKSKHEMEQLLYKVRINALLLKSDEFEYKKAMKLKINTSHAELNMLASERRYISSELDCFITTYSNKIQAK